MRPRFIINKGIRYDVTAVGRVFNVGTRYVASIYNPKDTSLKIVATATCFVEDERNTIEFYFTAEDTNKLKVGFATIEIYDTSMHKMVFRDNFAVIRNNSLPIEPTDIDEPVLVINRMLPAEQGAVADISLNSLDFSKCYTFKNNSDASVAFDFEYTMRIPDTSSTTTETTFRSINAHEELVFDSSLEEYFYDLIDSEFPDYTELASLSIKDMENKVSVEVEVPVEIDIYETEEESE